MNGGDMKRRRAVAVLCIGMAATMTVAAQDVDVAEDELRRAEDSEIEFTNYEGPVSVSESVDMIRSIGEFLGEEEIDEGQSREYFGRYRVIRAVDSSVVDGLDADIFVVLENARVDHIRNLRLMVSGYLQTAYGYSADSASVVAELTTIYNAVYRGDMDNFEQRYKSVVYENLSAERAGLSTFYEDWPGQTQMVIPLRADRALIDPFELGDAGVIGELRERDDMGIAERRSLVELMEEIVDLEREDIEESRERIAAELEAIEERESRLLERQESLEALDEDERDQAEEEIEREESELADRTAELIEESEDVAESEEQVEELQDEVQEQRDSIAEDHEERLEDDEVEASEDQDEDPDEREETAAASSGEADTVVVVEAENGTESSRGRLVRVSREQGTVESRSDIRDVVLGSLRDFADGYLVIRYTSEDHGVLQRIDGEGLSVSAEAAENLFPGSEVLIEGSDIYAVIEDGETWQIGRFDEELQLQAASAVGVTPATFLYGDAEIVIVQLETGGFEVLESQTLEDL
ncbi:MAG: P83/100 family protein [Spirochaetia bacterium]